MFFNTSEFLNQLNNLNDDSSFDSAGLKPALNMILTQFKSEHALSQVKHMDYLCEDNLIHYERKLGVSFLPVQVKDISKVRMQPPFLLKLSLPNEENRMVFAVLLHDRHIIYYDQIIKKNITLTLNTRISDHILSSWQVVLIADQIPMGMIALLKQTLHLVNTRFYIIFLAGILSCLSPILMSFLTAWFINNLHFGMESINPLGITSLCCVIFGMALLGFWNDFYVKMLNVKMMSYIIPGLIRKMLFMPSKKLKFNSSAEWVQKINDYEQALNQFLPKLISLMINVCGLIVLFGLLLVSMPKIALGYVIMAAFISFFKYQIARKNSQLVACQMNLKGKSSLFLQETLFQIIKIRSANALKHINQQWLLRLVKIKLCIWRSIKLDIMSNALDFVMPLLMLAIVCIFLVLADKPTHALDLLLMLVMSSSQFLMVFDKCIADATGLVTLRSAFDNLRQFNLSSESDEHSTPIFNIPIQGALRLMNVCLQNDFNQTLLNNITLEIPEGHFVAIVGKSGAGKSSLLSVILNLTKPTSGKIMLGDLPLAHICAANIRKHFSAVLQTSSLFPGTVFYNIALHSGMNVDEAWQLAHDVGLDKEICAMPMGMMTLISDNAAESISGGQKQKILIARALASKPRILCLDEATSSLDNHSQAIIFKHLKKLAITKIVIAHRPSTIRDADHIYVLDTGEIIAQGSYLDLVKNGKWCK